MSQVIAEGVKGYRCSRCGCLFTIETEDINYESAHGIFGIGYYYVKCPQCSKRIKVEDSMP